MHSIDQLAACEHIIEWIGLNDPRLAAATGVPAPNSGASVRENWKSGLPPDRLAAEIARLLVPRTVQISQPPSAVFHTSEITSPSHNRVLPRFASRQDWLACFPLGGESQPRKGTWAGVALCCQLGLAVFAQKLPAQDSTEPAVEARIQPLPMAVFERLTA